VLDAWAARLRLGDGLDAMAARSDVMVGNPDAVDVGRRVATWATTHLGNSSLPWRLRVLLGHDGRLCAEVLEVFVALVSRSSSIAPRHPSASTPRATR